MTNLNELRQLLAAANLDLSAIEVRSSRELRASVPREKLTQFADYLRGLNDARPELIVAEDTRLENGGFILRYLFELEDATAVVVTSVGVPAQDPVFPSLATRWYLASRFEREIPE